MCSRMMARRAAQLVRVDPLTFLSFPTGMNAGVADVAVRVWRTPRALRHRCGDRERFKDRIAPERVEA